ncbi:hypothetical protein [Hymenobacter arizonensis]|uniref:Uncharacterized protein n=1 Tax=Hymenobacter arizonensis TaxID=1227077 RepID=A0A1I5TE75_HYMAR|nr:hypothetical protein [Hymenobacter arizonensis]SFP81334.1 hypothetical protein SAMN04515668_0437 [Hymenobacter arizonensis]
MMPVPTLLPNAAPGWAACRICSRLVVERNHGLWVRGREVG